MAKGGPAPDLLGSFPALNAAFCQISGLGGGRGWRGCWHGYCHVSGAAAELITLAQMGLGALIRLTAAARTAPNVSLMLPCTSPVCILKLLSFVCRVTIRQAVRAGGEGAFVGDAPAQEEGALQFPFDAQDCNRCQ